MIDCEKCIYRKNGGCGYENEGCNYIPIGVPAIPISVIEEIKDKILDNTYFDEVNSTVSIRETVVLNIIDDVLKEYTE